MQSKFLVIPTAHNKRGLIFNPLFYILQIKTLFINKHTFYYNWLNRTFYIAYLYLHVQKKYIFLMLTLTTIYFY